MYEGLLGILIRMFLDAFPAVLQKLIDRGIAHLVNQGRALLVLPGAAGAAYEAAAKRYFGEFARAA